jgi:Alw26I/Eco31I/Esp3I family type II restriction m6 adenine DNA methyltransferase
MRHADLLSDKASTNLDHARRAFGRYYTPMTVAVRLAADLRAAASGTPRETIDCIDPFCGDGRLICQLLTAFSGRIPEAPRWRIWLYDLDPVAAEEARRSVTAVAANLGLPCEISAEKRDAFSLLPEHAGQFDIVVTNPPWEALKPDRREMGSMTDSDRAAYLEALRHYDSSLAAKLPWSQPERKFSGWGTNLSRCGLELALRLVRPDSGSCGIVLPASVMNDQTSARLRRWMFQRFHVRRVAHYPAEARLFDGVDQPFITLLASSGRDGDGTVVDRYSPSGALCDSGTISLSPQALSALGYSLPCDVPNPLMQLLARWKDLAALGDLEGRAGEGLWMGRELDETGYSRFTGPVGTVPFIKGRMVQRYVAPVQFDLFIADPTLRLPQSTTHPRLTWRDVSRRSQRRRVQAAVIPRGPVTGNSLHVAFYRDDDEDRLLALLALINSLPVELQVRSGLGTGHVSLGVMRGVKVPSLDRPETVKRLASLARAAIDGRPDAERKVERAVAELYGMEPETMQLIERFCSNPYENI